MGQANSRQRPPQRPTPAQDHPRSTIVSEASTLNDGAPSTESATTTNKRSRRASLRRSILGLVPSSSSSSSPRSRKDSSTSNSSQPSRSLRERWRSSRRFSKAPANFPDLAETSQQPAALDADGEVMGTEGPISEVSSVRHSQSLPSGPSASSAASRSSTPRLAVTEHDRLPKQGSSAAVRSDSGAQVPTIVPSEPTTPAPTRPTTEEIRREVAEFLNGHAEEPSVPASNQSEHATNESNREPPPTSGGANNNPQTSPQHFPPPGTLVVVQGVVNTTDTPHSTAPHNAATSSHPTSSTAPSRSSPAFHSPPTAVPVLRRANSVSTPPSSLGMSGSEERTSSRSRLSSFIRPSRGPSDGVSHAHSASVPDADLSSPRSTLDSPSSMSTTDSSTPPTTPSDTPHIPPSHEVPTSPSRGLSPGSIDVLGTLLSVAAAATAASLFSPGLSQSNPQSNLTAPPSPQQPTVRPLSPTPTAGLGALGGLGGLAGLGLNPPNAASATPQDSRERIRNVWESIRERVGLNSRNSAMSERPSTEPAVAPVATNPPSPVDAGPPAGSDRMRPSEMMLAEMARALNAGLGLAGTAGSTNTASNNVERQSSTGEGANPNAAHVLFPPIVDGASTLPPEGSFERFLANLQQDLRNILSEEPSVAQDSTPTSVSAGSTELTAAAADEGQLLYPEDAEHAHHAEEEPISDHDEDPPALETDSEDSESNFQDADEEIADGTSAEDAITPTAVRTDTPMPPAGGAPASPSQADEPTAQRRRERPAINLWRLYRFDPIPANHTHEHATHTRAGSTPSGVDPARSSEASSPTGEASSPSSDTDGQTPSSTIPASTPANVVVPVIVVGLQSVDINDHDEPEDEPVATAGQPAGPSTPVSDTASQDGGRPLTPRGRTWPSRAANALRTWRPGRRGSRTRRNAEGTGSRTFLIYVIGGYYPPNHHMVTGSDNLDSYEALWELAELLGQVKPPTATREDITNSGLQIIKASELSRYEEEGKVASNCVDRCLVCLDDYEPDSDLRVMSCRHAFHKDCVDKWLTVGRNNCPACRTKGVSVSGDPPSPPPSEPATA